VTGFAAVKTGRAVRQAGPAPAGVGGNQTRPPVIRFHKNSLQNAIHAADFPAIIIDSNANRNTPPGVEKILAYFAEDMTLIGYI
jgi:hypothetical protein